MSRPDLLDLLTRDRRRLVAVRGHVEGALPDVERLWRKAHLRMENGPQAGQTLSLEDMIDRHRRMVLVDAGDGPQPVETVFTSLLFIVAETLADPAAMERFLRERMRHSFGTLIDPLDDVAIAVETSVSAAHALTVSIGYGIHAPEEERPRGRVLFRPAGEPDGSPVTLPGGRAAAIYPTQRWLAFSRSEALTPATHPDLPSGATFLLTPPDEIGGRTARAGAGPALIVLDHGGRDGQRSIEAREAAADGGAADVDLRFEILGTSGQQGASVLGTLDVSFDPRPSRLRKARPAGPCLDVIGVAVPTRLEGSRVSRFWIELDGDGLLRRSLMIGSSQACVVQGSRARLYSRREMRYVGAAPFRARAVAVGSEKRSLVISTEGAIGHVGLPSTPASFAFGGDGDWDLDWIDQSVFVELSGGRIAPLGPLLPRRELGRLSAGPGGVAVESGGDAWLLDKDRARPAAGPLQPGQELVLGPLVLRVPEAER